MTCSCLPTVPCKSLAWPIAVSLFWLSYPETEHERDRRTRSRERAAQDERASDRKRKYGKGSLKKEPPEQNTFESTIQFPYYFKLYTTSKLRSSTYKQTRQAKPPGLDVPFPSPCPDLVVRCSLSCFPLYLAPFPPHSTAATTSTRAFAKSSLFLGIGFKNNDRNRRHTTRRTVGPRRQQRYNARRPWPNTSAASRFRVYDPSQ